MLPHEKRLVLGFSLLELLIVTAIAAIVAASSAPLLSESLRQSRLTAGSNSLFVALHFARSQALLRNQPWALCLSDDGWRCKTGRNGPARGWLVLPAAASELAMADPTRGLASQQRMLLDREIDLSGSRLKVTFWPVSRSGTTATFRLCIATTNLPPRNIIVSQTGRPRLQIQRDRQGCAAS